jgi:polyferredoxin
MSARDKERPRMTEESGDQRLERGEAARAPEAAEAGRPPATVSAGARALTALTARLRRSHARTIVRGAFTLFFVYLCVKLWLFYLWAMGAGPYVARPEAVAGIIPVGAYMSFFAWLKTGVYDPVIPAGVTIVVGALLLSLVLKRAFCGWLCPIGALWEVFGWAGKKTLPLQPVPWRWLDLTLRTLRYVLTFLLLFWIFSVPVEEASSFQQLPYYAVADIKIISLFVRLPWWYVAIGAAVAGASFLFGNVWCRYLCPLGGLYGAVGVASPLTVVRDADACVDCGRCSGVCHARVDVMRAGSVHAPECDGCQECVEVCPEAGALEGRVLRRWTVSPWMWAGAVVALWLLVYAIALVTGHWRSGLTPEQFQQAVRAVRI